ncbi:MAG: nucleotidyl transferase AbiEii/AbiGii toxin family protein, partial [Candidatus Paceibacterota bacterium]
MHYETLDEKRRALLPALDAFKQEFYLAGGTALALQIGHRVSVDFDFFTEQDFETEEVYERVQKAFGQVSRTQESPRTLAILVQDDVRISFMGYHYPLLHACVDTEHLRLASMLDIGCMKLGAIVSRAELKDYVDLFFILKHLPLPDLLAALSKKLPSLDQNLVLKALVSFD